MNISLSPHQFDILELFLNSILELSSISFDEQNHRLSMQLERIYFEEYKEKNVLFLFTIRNYKDIDTEVVIENIPQIKRVNKDKENKHNITRDAITQFEVINGSLVIETSYKEIINIPVNSSMKVRIRDINKPSHNFLTTMPGGKDSFKRNEQLLEKAKMLEKQ